jgi:hypothetical protein
MTYRFNFNLPKSTRSMFASFLLECATGYGSHTITFVFDFF